MTGVSPYAVKAVTRRRRKTAGQPAAKKPRRPVGDSGKWKHYRRVDHWIRKGYIPGVTAAGSGSKRVWSWQALATVEIMLRLVTEAGMTPEKASRVADTCVKNSPESTTMCLGLGLDLVVDWPQERHMEEIRQALNVPDERGT